MVQSHLRLVTTGVGVQVVIRSAEPFDLGKIKPTQSEAEYRFSGKMDHLKLDMLICHFVLTIRG